MGSGSNGFDSHCLPPFLNDQCTSAVRPPTWHGVSFCCSLVGFVGQSSATSVSGCSTASSARNSAATDHPDAGDDQCQPRHLAEGDGGFAKAGPAEMIEGDGHGQLSGNYQHHEQQCPDARPGEGCGRDEESAEQAAAPVPPGQLLECAEARQLTLAQGHQQQRQAANGKGNQRGGEDTGKVAGKLAIDTGLQRQHRAGEEGQGQQPAADLIHGKAPQRKNAGGYQPRRGHLYW